MSNVVLRVNFVADSNGYPKRRYINATTYDLDSQRIVEPLIPTTPLPIGEFMNVLNSVVNSNPIYRMLRVMCRVDENYVEGEAGDRWFYEIERITYDFVNPHNRRLGLQEVELKFMKP